MNEADGAGESPAKNDATNQGENQEQPAGGQPEPAPLSTRDERPPSDSLHPGRMLTDPSAKAAGTLGRMDTECSKYFGEVIEAIKWQADRLESGTLDHPVEMLTAQAITLNALFHRSLRIATAQGQSTQHAEMLFGVAMKAQAQSARALQAAVELKQGTRKVLIAQQANIAGQQVVNNGTAPRPPKSDAAEPCIVRSAESPKIDRKDHATLDARIPQEAVGRDPELETVEAIDGS